MSIERMLLVLRARWGLLLGVFLGTIALLLPLALSVSPPYKASASVLVEKPPHASADPMAGMALPPGVMSNYVATQVDVLRSQHVALRALRAIGLHEAPEWIEKWKERTDGRGDYESWLADYALRKLDVTPSRDSNVLSLSYRSPDPGLASAVANAFVQAYIDTTLEMRVEPARGYSSFFDERAEQLKSALEQARARLTAHQEKHGLMMTDEGVDFENRRLAELNSQLVALQDDVASAKARQGQARKSPLHMQEVLSDPVVASLTAELSRREAQLSEMQSHLGAQHPEMIDMRAGIAELRSRTNAAIQRASSSSDVSMNVAQGRLSELRAAVEKQRAKVTQQKAQRDTAAVLAREVENAQRAYDAVLARASQTALESKNTLPNVLRLKVATPPPSPLWPYWLHVAVPAVLGLILGALIALMREARDRRLRTVQDVFVRLEQPLLLELPDGRARRGRDSTRAIQAQARLVGSVPRLTAH